MNLVDVLSGIFATKEAKDALVNEVVKVIVNVINTNKVAINQSIDPEKLIDIETVKVNFENDIEKISPGNAFSTWDQPTLSYKNLQLNLLWEAYKTSAFRHCNKSESDKQYQQFLKHVEDIKKQLSKYNNGTFPEFPKFPDFTQFPTLKFDENSQNAFDKLVDTLFKNLK